MLPPRWATMPVTARGGWMAAEKRKISQHRPRHKAHAPIGRCWQPDRLPPTSVHRHSSWRERVRECRGKKSFQTLVGQSVTSNTHTQWRSAFPSCPMQHSEHKTERRNNAVRRKSKTKQLQQTFQSEYMLSILLLSTTNVNLSQPESRFLITIIFTDGCSQHGLVVHDAGACWRHNRCRRLCKNIEKETKIERTKRQFKTHVAWVLQQTQE